MLVRRLHCFVVLVFLVLLGSSNLTGGQLTPGGGSTQISGQFNALVACYFEEGYSRTTYVLTTDEGKEYKAIFRPHQQVPTPGSRVTLSGRLDEDAIFVDYVMRVLGPDGNDNPTTGEQKCIIALINFQNDTTENVTVQQVEQRMFNPNYSADRWWRENSYGKTWATGDVVGWITLPMNRECDPSRWRTLTIEALDQMVYLPQYNRLIILVPGGGGCSWGGLGTLGPSTYQTRNGPWRTTTAWCRSEYYNENLYHPRAAVFVTAHEVGHNFGRHHSRSIVWNQNRALGPFDCGGCEGSVSEYGNAFCALGGSWRPGHHNAMHKRSLGWFEPGNVVDVTRSGIYSIDPYAISSNDPKVLRIHRGFAPTQNLDEYLYVEWRQPIGFDDEINYFGGSNYDGVLMHYEFLNNTGTYILDMTPGDNELQNAALRTGRTWTDQYTHLSVRPLGVQNGRMQVQVQIGQPVLPNSYTIVTGFEGSGGLQDLFSSDNNYLTVASAPNFSDTTPAVVIDFSTTHNGPNPGAFRFEFEAKTSSVVRQRVRLWNFSTNSWNTVSNRDSTRNDSFVEANIWSNTSRYIHSTTREMRARVEWFINRPIYSWPLRAHVDQAIWQILR